MNNLQLKFKPRTVRELEKEHGSIMDLFDTNLENLILLIKTGNGGINVCTDEQAEDILETFLENGGDTTEALIQIVEALEKSGFLPRDLALGKVLRLKLEASYKQLKNQLLEEVEKTSETVENQ